MKRKRARPVSALVAAFVPVSGLLPVGGVVLPAASILGPAPVLAAQDREEDTGGAGPDAVVGTWQGALALPGGASLRLVFHVEADAEGALSASMDSPDQGAFGIAVAEATFEGGWLALEMPPIGARYEGTLSSEGTLEGDWVQGGQSLPLRLERVDAEAARAARPQEPEPPFPYRTEDVEYPNEEAGIRLAGTLTLPEGDGPFPAVVLISGSGPQNRDSEVFGHRPFLVLADHLTRAGIAVLRSDDRGVGDSDGSFSEATTRDFAGDAAAAVARLRAHPNVDPDAIGLLGMSEGGLVAPMVAAESDDVAFVVLLAAPAVTGEEILHLQGELIARAEGVPEEVVAWNRQVQDGLFEIVRNEADPDARGERLEAFLREAVEERSDAELQAMGLMSPEAREGWISAQAAAMGGPWFRFFLVHDPAEVLRQVQAPVLALYGEVDLQVPPVANLPAMEAALAEAGTPDATAVELPGLNHLFQTAGTGAPTEYARIEETMAPEVLERVAGWILERTGR